MTVKELYDKIGGNYDQAIRIMKMEKLVDRYIRKLGKSTFVEALVAAADSMDAVALFENAHAMKGVCANLGLQKLAAAADTVTEEFRPGSARKLSDDEVRALLRDTEAVYKNTLEQIRLYEQGA